MNWKWIIITAIWLCFTVLFTFSLMPYPVADSVRGFSSEEELCEWLNRDKTDSNYRLANTSCYDVAEHLVSQAELQGYRLNIEILNDKEYEYYYGNDNTPVNPQNWSPYWSQNGYYHAVVSARIGEQVFLIEPQTDEVWFYADLIGRGVYD